MQQTTERHVKYAPEITWPKEFPELKLIDDALRCGICYDYIKTCMVTPCAHSYCSICIRRSLLYKTACPTCFEETFDTSLRNNRILDRVTELFSSMKEKLVKHLKIAAVQFSGNEQVSSPVGSQILQKSRLVDVTPKRSTQKPLKTSTKGKLQFMPKSEASISKTSGRSDISKRLEDILGSPATKDSLNSEVIIVEPLIDNENPRPPSVPPMFLQPKTDIQPKSSDMPTVLCPVCNVNIPERNINVHLDNCLTNADKPPIKISPGKLRQKRNPLPKMVWSLMAEKDLRKKLKEYGLNTQGDKKALTSRIQRYILLFNSECDSDNPRPVSEIIRQVEKEEKQTPAQSHQRLFMNSKCDPKVVEEENKKYIEENKNSFKKLIEAMREREGRNIKPLSHSFQRILSDDDDDNLNINKSKGRNLNKPTNELPSTSKQSAESIDLCDSSESVGIYSVTSSPILGGPTFVNKEQSSVHASDSSVSDLTPNSLTKNAKNISETNKANCSNLYELCSMFDVSDGELHNDNSSNSSIKKPTSLSGSLSPSCIITAHNSESEDSFSILDNQDCGDGFFDNPTEVPESVPNINSQLDDPDFVVDTEENENSNDEIFIPQRRSKRKFQNSVLTDSKQTLNSRRTRRRLSKSEK